MTIFSRQSGWLNAPLTLRLMQINICGLSQHSLTALSNCMLKRSVISYLFQKRSMLIFQNCIGGTVNNQETCQIREQWAIESWEPDALIKASVLTIGFDSSTLRGYGLISSYYYLVANGTRYIKLCAISLGESKAVPPCNIEIYV